MYIYCIVSIFRQIVNGMIPYDFPNYPYYVFLLCLSPATLVYIFLWDMCPSGTLGYQKRVLHLMGLKFWAAM